jgi:hypothetical protein
MLGNRPLISDENINTPRTKMDAIKIIFLNTYYLSKKYVLYPKSKKITGKLKPQNVLTHKNLQLDNVFDTNKYTT